MNYNSPDNFLEEWNSFRQSADATLGPLSNWDNAKQDQPALDTDPLWDPNFSYTDFDPNAFVEDLAGDEFPALNDPAPDMQYLSASWRPLSRAGYAAQESADEGSEPLSALTSCGASDDGHSDYGSSEAGGLGRPLDTQPSSKEAKVSKPRGPTSKERRRMIASGGKLKRYAALDAVLAALPMEDSIRRSEDVDSSAIHNTSASNWGTVLKAIQSPQLANGCGYLFSTSQEAGQKSWTVKIDIVSKQSAAWEQGIPLKSLTAGRARSSGRRKKKKACDITKEELDPRRRATKGAEESRNAARNSVAVAYPPDTIRRSRSSRESSFTRISVGNWETIRNFVQAESLPPGRECGYLVDRSKEEGEKLWRITVKIVDKTSDEWVRGESLTEHKLGCCPRGGAETEDEDALGEYISYNGVHYSQL